MHFQLKFISIGANSFRQAARHRAGNTHSERNYQQKKKKKKSEKRNPIDAVSHFSQQQQQHYLLPPGEAKNLHRKKLFAQVFLLHPFLSRSLSLPFTLDRNLCSSLRISRIRAMFPFSCQLLYSTTSHRSSTKQKQQDPSNVTHHSQRTKKKTTFTSCQGTPVFQEVLNFHQNLHPSYQLMVGAAIEKPKLIFRNCNKGMKWKPHTGKVN